MNRSLKSCVIVSLLLLSSVTVSAAPAQRTDLGLTSRQKLVLTARALHEAAVAAGGGSAEFISGRVDLENAIRPVGNGISIWPVSVDFREGGETLRCGYLVRATQDGAILGIDADSCVGI